MKSREQHRAVKWKILARGYAALKSNHAVSARGAAKVYSELAKQEARSTDDREKAASRAKERVLMSVS